MDTTNTIPRRRGGGALRIGIGLAGAAAVAYAIYGATRGQSPAEAAQRPSTSIPSAQQPAVEDAGPVEKEEAPPVEEEEAPVVEEEDEAAPVVEDEEEEKEEEEAVAPVVDDDEQRLIASIRERQSEAVARLDEAVAAQQELDRLVGELVAAESFSRTASVSTLEILVESSRPQLELVRAEVVEIQRAMREAESAVGDASAGLDDLLVLTARVPQELAGAQQVLLRKYEQEASLAWQATPLLDGAEAAFASILQRWEASAPVDCTLVWRTSDVCMLPNGSRPVQCGEQGFRDRWQEVVSPANSRGTCAPATEKLPCSGPPCPVPCRVAEPDLSSQPCLDDSGAPAACLQAGTKSAPPIVTPPMHGGAECTEAQLAPRSAACVGPCAGEYEDVRVTRSVEVVAGGKLTVRGAAVIRRVLNILKQVPAAPKKTPTAAHEPASKHYVDSALNGFPIGTIVPYAGTAAVPTGWAICDGTQGTPDLVNRFAKGASDAEPPGTTGGAATRTLSSSEHLVEHDHGDLAAPAQATITTSEAPAHEHVQRSDRGAAYQAIIDSTPGSDTTPIYWSQPSLQGLTRSGNQFVLQEDQLGYYRDKNETPDTRAVATLNGLQNPAPQSQASNSGQAANAVRHLTASEKARKTIHDGDHSHTVDMLHTHWTGDAGQGEAFNIEPPYFTLVFIMRVA